MMRSLVAALGTLAAGAAFAETLTDAWTLALQNDRSLAAARLESEAGRIEAAAARALRYPSLTASSSFVQFADAPAFDFTEPRAFPSSSRTSLTTTTRSSAA